MASSDTYRAAIVGLRGIGAGAERTTFTGARRAAPHTHASAYHAHGRTDLVAVCDLASDLVTQCADTWGPLATYTDFAQMLEREQIDILSIATSDHTHAALGIAAAEAGVPMIFCEKPMTTTLAHADALLAAVQHAGCTFAIDHTRRWDPFFRHAYDFIQSGRLGTVRRVIGTWTGARALEYRNGSHTVDAVNMYAGGEPVWVVGHHEPGPDGAEPAPSALIEYDNGVLAFINQSKGPPRFNEWQVFCDEGRIRIGGSTASVEFMATTPNGEQEWLERQLPNQMVYRSSMLRNIDDLLAVHENGGETFANIHTGLRAVEVIHAMRQSHERGNAKIEFPLPR